LPLLNLAIYSLENLAKKLLNQPQLPVLPLEITTQVEIEFIQGRKIDLSDRQKMLYAKYQEKYRQLRLIK